MWQIITPLPFFWGNANKRKLTFGWFFGFFVQFIDQLLNPVVLCCRRCTQSLAFLCDNPVENLKNLRNIKPKTPDAFQKGLENRQASNIIDGDVCMCLWIRMLVSFISQCCWGCWLISQTSSSDNSAAINHRFIVMCLF